MIFVITGIAYQYRFSFALNLQVFFIKTERRANTFDVCLGVRRTCLYAFGHNPPQQQSASKRFFKQKKIE